MSDTKKYILLTGGKNNAGDFLIKTRAKGLLKKYRPDRAFVDLDGWKPLTEEQIELINQSEALILTGGPSLQPQDRIRTLIYPLTDPLSRIKVPILTFGAGYKGSQGSWEETLTYNFSRKSLQLLQRINESGFQSSVRDYHTLHTLRAKGFNNFLMTGCPALYDTKTEKIGSYAHTEIKKVGFSLGVSYKLNKSMDETMKKLITELKNLYDNKLIIYFHHKIKMDDPAEKNSVNWLKSNNIEFKDISGDSEKLMTEYSSCDLHLGFRVHAHIFCSSIGKPSILLSEDGRAVALKEVLSGLIFKAHEISGESIVAKGLNKLKLTDRIKAVNHLDQTVLSALNYNLSKDPTQFNQPFSQINALKEQMVKYLKQLP